MFVDSHCHLDFPEFAGELPALLDAMADAQVTHALCIAVNLPDWPAVHALATAHRNLYATVGVHPDYEDTPEPTVDELVALAAQPKIVAIGETGLDYYRLTGDLEWQRERFRTHIRAARRAGKPLVIHTRTAGADTLAIMREENAGEAGGVMHCFTETWEVARAALDLGFHISFSGIVTFKNAHALKDVARRVPLDRMLIETDSPYLAPVPYPREAQPARVRASCGRGDRAIARTARRDHRAATSANFFRLFDIDPQGSSMTRDRRRCAPRRRSAWSALHRSRRRRPPSTRSSCYDDFVVAVANDRAADVRALLARGVDPNASTQRRAHADRRGAQRVAARSTRCSRPRRRQRAQPIRRHRADDRGAQRPPRVMKKLRARSAEVNQPGWTALIYAATGGHDDARPLSARRRRRHQRGVTERHDGADDGGARRHAHRRSNC